MFLIKLIEPENISTFHEYETSLIYCVADMNRVFVESNNLSTTCLGCLGVKYLDKKSQTGFLEIETISQMLEQGYGKCDSIVAWFITVLSLQGIEAQPLIVPTNKGGFHVKMQYRENNSWIVIDPAIDLQTINKQTCDECKRKR